MGKSLFVRTREFHKRDANEDELRMVLNTMGVESHCILGQEGEPDLMCEYEGLVFLVECKATRGKLSERQRRWHLAFNGPAFIARKPEDLHGIVQKVIEHYQQSLRRILNN